MKSQCSAVSLRPLCPTRWTARTGAIESVLKDYSVLMETMEEVAQSTHDEYGLKASGILLKLEKFDTLFSLRLGYLFFSAAEEVSKQLQSKDLSLQEALSAVRLAAAFFRRQRSDAAFTALYDKAIQTATELAIGEPQLPRYRRQPARIDSGSSSHRFVSPRDYYRSIYFQVCDLLLQELQDRFDQHLLSPVLALEALIIKAANGESYDSELQSVQDSCYAGDLDCTTLKRHLPLLVDVVKLHNPRIRKVTSVRTVCDAMNVNETHKGMLAEVHKLLRLYLTIPVTSSTSERTFSALRRLLTYLRSTMTEKRLNNCMLLHVHKDITDDLSMFEMANEFISANSKRKNFFGSFDKK